MSAKGEMDGGVASPEAGGSAISVRDRGQNQQRCGQMKGQGLRLSSILHTLWEWEGPGQHPDSWF